MTDDDFTPEEIAIILALLEVESFRCALGLRNRDGLSCAQLATLYNVDRSSIYKTEQRALNKLRQSLILTLTDHEFRLLTSEDQ